MSNIQSPYKIVIGRLSVEAPTKEECISLLQEACKINMKHPIDEAIR